MIADDPSELDEVWFIASQQVIDANVAGLQVRRRFSMEWDSYSQFTDLDSAIEQKIEAIEQDVHISSASDQLCNTAIKVHGKPYSMSGVRPG